MKTLEDLLRRKRTIRVIGFDDAPFERRSGELVNVAGVVCAGTRFEGMVWGSVREDGDDATDTLARLLMNSKFHAQVHLMLIDGLALGGFNLLDLHELARRIDRPCISVMRKPPDMASVEKALKKFPDTVRRLNLIRRAGPVHMLKPFYFQVKGVDASTAGKVLNTLTDQGHVPEALRLAHLIGSAIMTGQSGKRA
ncbi:MAG: DUF99 family protein [Gammaproteobacteria bacterium]|nr:DUF99 family protein [Gammaproteobacteria bacterium]